MFKNTYVMCVLSVTDPNTEDGTRFVDLGNYYETDEGMQVLILSKEDATKYGHLVNCPIYVRRQTR